MIGGYPIAALGFPVNGGGTFLFQGATTTDDSPSGVFSQSSLVAGLGMMIDNEVIRTGGAPSVAPDGGGFVFFGNESLRTLDTVIATVGDTVDGDTLTGFAGAAATSGGSTAYRAYFTQGTAIVVDGKRIAFAGHLLDGKMVLNLSGAPALSSSGSIAFLVDFPEGRAIYTEAGLVVGPGSVVAGSVVGDVFNSRVSINASGVIPFLIDRGVFTQDGAVAVPGDFVDDDLLVSIIGNPMINDRGQIAFYANVTSGQVIVLATPAGEACEIPDANAAGWPISYAECGDRSYCIAEDSTLPGTTTEGGFGTPCLIESTPKDSHGISFEVWCADFVQPACHHCFGLYRRDTARTLIGKCWFDHGNNHEFLIFDKTKVNPVTGAPDCFQSSVWTNSQDPSNAATEPDPRLPDEGAGPRHSADGKVDKWIYRHDVITHKTTIEVLKDDVIVYPHPGSSERNTFSGRLASSSFSRPGFNDLPPWLDDTPPQDSPMTLSGSVSNCDVNGDGRCDAEDIALFEASFGRCIGDPLYQVASDANLDGCVTAADRQLLFPSGTVPPAVLSIAPRGGSAAGGTRVMIRGTGFLAGARVLMGGQDAEDIRVLDSTAIEATAPPHPTGTVEVLILNPDNLSGGVEEGFFYGPVDPPLAFYTIAPCRVVDTRSATTGSGGGPVLALSRRLFVVADACGIPATAKSVSANVTVVRASAAGFISLYPGNGFPSGTSSLNFVTGETRANNAILLLSTDGAGAIGVQNGALGDLDFILDVNGYFQ